MRKLERDEMLKIEGGSTLSSTLISALTRAGNTIKLTSLIPQYYISYLEI